MSRAVPARFGCRPVAVRLVAAALSVLVLLGLDACAATRVGTVAPAPQPSVSTMTTNGSPTHDPVSGLRWVDLRTLPSQAQHTVALIEAGGPFPYRKDGAVFANRERLLPAEPTGYYREYTVPTPGAPDRGARRIIGGRAGELYWTADHYASFARIRP